MIELHAGHPGVSRMKSLMRGLVWWPRIDAEVEVVVKKCSVCQVQPSSPLHPWQWPSRPWSRLHIDFAGPVDGKMLLIVIDAPSKWVEAIPMTSTTSTLTIKQLRRLFSQFGLPETLVSDNGPQFAAKEFEEFCCANGIKHIRVAPYHPSSNGLAERAVRIVKDGLKKQAAGDLLDKLSRVLISYRITPQTTTGVAPAELMFGRNLRSRLDLLRPSARDSRVVLKQSVQKEHHDQHAKPRTFKMGDSVFVKNHRPGAAWLPGVTGPVSYRVQLGGGQIICSHQDHLRSRLVEEVPSQTTDSSDDLVDVPTPTSPPEPQESNGNPAQADDSEPEQETGNSDLTR